MPRVTATGLLIGCLGLALGAPVSRAEIYRDPSQPTPTFSDRPSPDAEPVQLPPANVQNFPDPPATPVNQGAAPAPFTYEQIAIIEPADEATVRDNQGRIRVIAEVKPPLRAGHQLQLLLDGQPAGPVQRSGQFNLTGVNRGSHQLQLQVLDGEGDVFAQGPAVTLHLHQASRLAPARGTTGN